MQNGMLLNTSNIKSKTVNNAVIQLGDIDNSGKGKRFKSKFIQPGLVKIEGHGIVLLKKETIDQSLKSMIGSPVIVLHQDVTNDNANELRCGVISDAYFNEPDGWFYCEGIIWDEEAQQYIQNGWKVSCSYDFLSYNDEGGDENNIHYDKEFTKLNFTHLAIVNNPRYERANIVFNCKINNLRDGELPSDKGKWITVNGNHIFVPYGKTLDEVIEEKGWKDKKQSEGKKELKDKYKREDVDWDEEQLAKDIKTAQDLGYKEIEDIAEYLGLDEDEVRETLGSQEKYSELKAKLAQYKKQALEGDNSTITKQIIEGLQRQIDELKNNPKAYANARMKEMGLNRTNNSKEQDMTLLEEIKKLITKVENNKENEEMIENEKVDKRKLIDEVGGILKDKVDEEVWRTIIGKLEKMSYNESEAGTADNKKVKNEEEEKEEAKNQKCKNEDEEGEEKVEDIEEEVKEDVGNKKVKNSKEESCFEKINAIYNSIKQVQNESKYTSRQDKLDAAKEYFS